MAINTIIAYSIRLGVKTVSGCGSIRMMREKKDAAAVTLGRRGGKKKVPKGFSMLSQDEQKEIARRAAAARWKKKGNDING
jgi:hypothetical protein